MPKTKLILIAVIATILAGGLVLVYSLSNENFTYYHSVSEVLASPEKFAGKKIRVLGLVQSSNWDKQALKLDFVMTDNGVDHLKVNFSGVKPDLFKEGQGVVAEGVYQGNFNADQLLVKHSPEYKAVAKGANSQDYLNYIKSLQLN